MNCGGNALGQGNRANLDDRPGAAARRAQRRRRPPGRGRPGRPRQPGQARRSASPSTTPTRRSARSPRAAASTPGVDARHGVRRRGAALRRRPAVARRPRASPGRSPPACSTLHHPKLVLGFDAILVIGPEHGRVFAEAGWDRDRDRSPSSHADLQLARVASSSRGAGGMAEGMPESFADADAAEVPRPAACCWPTPVAAPGCSRPSSAAGPTAPSAAQPVTREVRT